MSATEPITATTVTPVRADAPAPVSHTETSGTGGRSSLLQSAASQAVDIVTKLSNVCRSRYQCPPMSPSYVSEAKAVLLLRGTKAGLGLGFRTGHGMLLARLPARSPLEPPRWSAPVFLKVTMGQLGFIAGYEQISSFLLAMTNKVLDQLLIGSHTVLGVDQSMVVVQTEVEDKSDIIAASNKHVDLVGVSHSAGIMLDFSLSGGSMSVNQAKMRQAYGPGVGMADAIKGIIPPPPELNPVYEKLSELVVGGRTPTISLTTTSLERFTAGYDPSRQIMGGAPSTSAAPAAQALPPAGPAAAAAAPAGVAAPHAASSGFERVAVGPSTVAAGYGGSAATSAQPVTSSVAAKPVIPTGGQVRVVQRTA